jgi:thiol-disulfide isomerase/thioredoxin
MNKFIGLIILLLLSIRLHLPAQTSKITKSILQQNFIAEHFIRNRTSSLEIKSTATIDSLFMEFKSSWEIAAPDTLKKYKLKIPLSSFMYIDAYCYLVSLINISGKFYSTGPYGEHLLKAYMIPAILKDLSGYQQHSNGKFLELIWNGSLTNAIAIGSGISMSREATVATFNLYSDFEKLCKPLRNSKDTRTRTYVDFLFKDIESYKPVLQTMISYNDQDYVRSLHYLLDGLRSKKYPAQQVLSISELLLKAFSKMGEKEKSLILLNALMANTTSESVHRELLRNWYIQIDPLYGLDIFDRILASLPITFFKNSEKRIDLPKTWDFIANPINATALKQTKYYLLDIWYTSCGACIKEVPDLNTFYEKLKGYKDVSFISVNTDFFNGTKDEVYVLERAIDFGIRFPIFYDNATSNFTGKLGVKSFPAKYILDSTGKIIIKLDNSKNSLLSFDMFIKELRSIESQTLQK